MHSEDHDKPYKNQNLLDNWSKTSRHSNAGSQQAFQQAMNQLSGDEQHHGGQQFAGLGAQQQQLGLGRLGLLKL